MFPKLTNINDKIVGRIKSANTINASQLNCFIRVIAGAGNGLIMSSNPDWKIFSAAGISEPSIYGDRDGSGVIGVNWLKKPVYATRGEGDIPFRPSPIITSLNVKEGKDQISRHCDLKLIAYTLNQVEILQSYLMEPGYSLFIEYGWNTNEGVGGLIPIDYKTIVSDAGKFSLDQTSLHAKRVQTLGEYDSFFGFIVGGTVAANGDAFDISIKLRGAPGLPTYLQSHNNIEEIKDGKVSNQFSRPPFGITDLNLPQQDQMGERRFKQMFNDLPKVRQTTFVTDLVKPEVAGGFSSVDFINFDPVIQVQITNFSEGRDSSGAELPDNEPIVPPNAGAAAKDVEAGVAGDRVNRIKEIAQKIFELQVGIDKFAVPPVAVDVEGGPFIDTLWEDYVESKITAGEPITAAEVSEAISKYLDVVKVAREAVFLGRDAYTATTYTLKPEPKPAPPPAEEPKPTVEQTGGGGTAAVEAIDKTEIKLAGGLMLPKEKLFSKNRYIRFKNAVDILNANSSIQSLIIGGRPVNVILNIKDTPIGAFKGIYSTKPETLVIPGLIPKFSKFFMEQNLANLNDGEPLIDRSIGPHAFAQPTALNSGGYKEQPYFWGKLENLYINFELLKKELDTANKTFRDVLETLLNEMSSAVDGFWNFQIVEKSEKVKDGSGVLRDTLVYTVIDENWIGANPNPSPFEFIHSGEQSVFLQANLSIDIPGATTSAIISKRLALSTNPSQPNLELGGVFSSQPDRFLSSYTKAVGAKGGTVSNVVANQNAAGTSGTAGAGGADTRTQSEKDLEEKLNKIPKDTLTEEQKKQMDALKARQKANSDLITANEAVNQKVRELQNERNSDPRKITEARRNEIDKEIETLTTGQQAKVDQINKEQADIQTALGEFQKAAEQQLSANVSSNLEKIDIVPNPEANEITQDNLNAFMGNLQLFEEKFRIYCCKDTKYLNILKTNELKRKVGVEGRLSHPLPIKYSFTILGKSGIRRGDTFNIIGIPKKYKQHGLFQVTEIEHTIQQDMKWTTTVQGEYRQQQ